MTDDSAAVDRVRDPRTPRPFVVLAFNSTRESLAAEAVLIDAGYEIRVIPLPPRRGSLCGIAIRLPPRDEPGVLDELARHRLVVAARDEIEDY